MSAWPMVKLGEVAKVASGGTPKTSIAEDWDGDVPWVTPKDLSNNKKLWISSGSRSITELGLAKSGATLLPSQTVLWSSRAPIGLVAIASNPIATNQGFKSFIPGNKLDSNYLAHFLIQSRAALQNLGVGATFKEVSAQRAAEIKVPLPPLGEQKWIAEMLSEVNNLIISTNSQRATVDQLERRLFQEFRNQNSKSSHRIIDKCQVHTGATPSRNNPTYYNGSIPWIKTGEVQGTLINNAEEHITETAIQETNCRKFPAGTTLVAMYGQGTTRGRAGILNCEAATNQACAAIIPHLTEDEDYTFAVLRNSYSKLRSLGRGGTQPNLNLTLIKNFEIPWPEKSTREDFMQRWRQLNTFRLLLAQRSALLQELQRSLSARAFAGLL